jgi:sporulation protein YlmC with PRC-barrel domain
MNRSRTPLIFMTMTLVLAMVLAACETVSPGPVVTEPGPEVVEPAVVTPGEGVIARGIGGAADMLIPASSLMGLEIDASANGEAEDAELGSIEDLMVDLNTGNILFATVEHGGFLDIGDRDLPVPLNALQFSDDTDELRFPVAAETFENFPDIADDWPADFAPGWEQEVGTFWTSAGIDTSILQGIEGNRVAWASDLMDYGLDSAEMPGFGDIQDLIVDLQNSSVRYIALSFADIGTYGSDWRLVPFSAVNLVNQTDVNAFTFNEGFDSTWLTESPVYVGDTFGDITTWNSTWDDDIEAFWTNTGIAVTNASIEAVDAVQEGTEAVQEGAEEIVEAPETDPNPGATEMNLLASTLLSKEVDNLNDEELGTIEDLLIDLNTGNILFATIEHGGFLDIGDSDFPVPLSAMQWGAEADEMIVSISPEMLETFPEIDNDWPGDFGEGWHSDLDTFWSGVGFDVSTIQDTPPGPIVRASELIGYGVGASDAPSMGTVEDIVIDLANSQVKYMVLSFSDSAAFGREWVAVPYSAFNAAAFGDEFVFADDFDRNLLVDAPRVDAEGIYDSAEFQTDWDKQIQAFWSEHGFNFEGM